MREDRLRHERECGERTGKPGEWTVGSSLFLILREKCLTTKGGPFSEAERRKPRKDDQGQCRVELRTLARAGDVDVWGMKMRKGEKGVST